MATITSKTTKALSVSLPGGKKLRLSPFKSAEIPAKAVDHPQVQKLIEAGEVEISNHHQKPHHASGGSTGSRPSTGAQGRGSGIRQSGDR